MSPKGPESLQKRVDEALASWPLPERDSRAWEDMARRIEAKIAAIGASRAPTGTLLDAPLPTEPHEAHVDDDRPTPRSMRTTSTKAPAERRLSQAPASMERERDRRSLKDLAKLAGSASLTPMPPPSSKGAQSVPPPPPGTRSHDSGIVDLKQMGVLDDRAAQAAPYPSSSGGAAAMVPPSPSRYPAPPPLPGRMAVAGSYPAPPPLSARPVAAPASLQPPPTRARAPSFNPYEKKKGRGTLWLGIAGIVAAAAAAILILTPMGAKLEARFSPPPPSAPIQTAVAPPAPPPPPPEAVASATPPPALSAAPEQPVAAIDTAPPPGSARGVAEPASLAPGAHSVAVPGHKSVTVTGGGGVAGKPAGAATPAAPPPNPALVAKNIPNSPSSGSSFDNALRQAAGPIDTPSGGDSNKSAPSAAAVESGNVPQKPSAGAIAAGVGVVMGGARGCLTSGDPVSFASVTFDSSGSVSSVSVSGSASGKPAEGCIKAALGRAKVPAFAQPSYSQKFTVRPN